nr:uncharacterized protein LOC123772381 isoform X4 [Procambarus clarkii]
MESDFDPLIRSLSTVDGDDLVSWCSDGDYGTCKAYLAHVISVDEEDDDSGQEDEDVWDENASVRDERPTLYITENGVGADSIDGQTKVSFANGARDVCGGKCFDTVKDLVNEDDDSDVPGMCCCEVRDGQLVDSDDSVSDLGKCVETRPRSVTIEVTTEDEGNDIFLCESSAAESYQSPQFAAPPDEPFEAPAGRADGGDDVRRLARNLGQDVRTNCAFVTHNVSEVPQTFSNAFSDVKSTNEDTYRSNNPDAQNDFCRVCETNRASGTPPPDILRRESCEDDGHVTNSEDGENAFLVSGVCGVCNTSRESTDADLQTERAEAASPPLGAVLQDACVSSITSEQDMTPDTDENVSELRLSSHHEAPVDDIVNKEKKADVNGNINFVFSELAEITQYVGNKGLDDLRHEVRPAMMEGTLGDECTEKLKDISMVLYVQEPVREAENERVKLNMFPGDTESDWKEEPLGEDLLQEATKTLSQEAAGIGTADPENILDSTYSYLKAKDEEIIALGDWSSLGKDDGAPNIGVDSPDNKSQGEGRMEHHYDNDVISGVTSGVTKKCTISARAECVDAVCVAQAGQQFSRKVTIGESEEGRREEVEDDALLEEETARLATWAHSDLIAKDGASLYVVESGRRRRCWGSCGQQREQGRVKALPTFQNLGASCEVTIPRTGTYLEELSSETLRNQNKFQCVKLGESQTGENKHRDVDDRKNVKLDHLEFISRSECEDQVDFAPSLQVNVSPATPGRRSQRYLSSVFDFSRGDASEEIISTRSESLNLNETSCENTYSVTYVREPEPKTQHHIDQKVNTLTYAGEAKVRCLQASSGDGRDGDGRDCGELCVLSGVTTRDEPDPQVNHVDTAARLTTAEEGEHPYEVNESGDSRVSGEGNDDNDPLLRSADEADKYLDDAEHRNNCEVSLTNSQIEDQCVGGDSENSEGPRAPAVASKKVGDAAEEPVGDAAEEPVGDAAEEPVGDAAEEPIGDVEEPVGDVEEPVGDVEEPVGDAAEEPVGDAAEEPIGDVEEPVGDVEEPVGDAAEEPVGDVEEPAGDAAEEPVGDAEEPVGDAAEEPVGDAAEEPVGDVEEPVGDVEEPVGDAAEEPVGDAAEEPVGDAAEEPVGDAVEELVGDAVEEPVGDAAEEPVGDAAEEPVGDVEEPVGDAAEEPVGDAAEEPVGDAAEEPVGDVEEPVGDAAEEPVGDVEEPVGDAVEEPVGDAAEEPVGDAAEEPVGDAAEEPVGDVEEPVGDAAEEPVGDAAEELVGDAAEEPVGDVEEPVGDAAEEQVGDAAEEPVGDAAEEPVGDAAEEPVGDVEEPVGDAAEEPVGDVEEPVGDAAEEPVGDAAEEPVGDAAEEPFGDVEEPVGDAAEEPVGDVEEPVGDAAEEPVGDVEEPVGDAAEEPVGDVEEPVDDAAGEPVGDAAEEPVGDAAGEPFGDVEEPVGDAAGEPFGDIEEPVDDAAEEPVGDAAEEPVGDVEEPVGDAAEEPVGDAAEEPVADAVEEPVGDAAEEPVGDAAEEPVGDAAEEPVGNAAEEPVGDAVEEPVGDAAEEPVGDAAGEPFGDVEEPVDDAAEEPVGDAVEEPVGDVEEPVGDAAEESVGDAAEEPVGNAAEEPVGDAVEEPVGDVEEPVGDAAEEPVSDAAEEPVGDAVEEPVGDAVEEPVGDAAEEPVGDAVEKTVGDAAEEPVGDTAEEPVGDAAEESVGDAAEEPVGDAAEEPVGDVEEPVGDAVEKTVGDAAEEPVGDAVEEPVGDAAKEPVGDAAEETVGDAAEEPVGDAAEEPVGDAAEEPVGDAAEEPVGDATEEPVGDAAEEPVGDAAEEPVGDAAEEPVDDAAEEPVDDAAEEPVGDVVEEPVDDAAEEPVGDAAEDINYDVDKQINEAEYRSTKKTLELAEGRNSETEEKLSSVEEEEQQRSVEEEEQQSSVEEEEQQSSVEEEEEQSSGASESQLSSLTVVNCDESVDETIGEVSPQDAENLAKEQGELEQGVVDRNPLVTGTGDDEVVLEDTPVEDLLEESRRLIKTDMSSNRDSGTSYLSEADNDFSDDDTLVGRSSDGDGVVMSGTEEGSSSGSAGGSCRNSDEIFFKSHRRDDSGVEVGSCYSDHQVDHHLDHHLDHQLDHQVDHQVDHRHHLCRCHSGCYQQDIDSKYTRRRNSEVAYGSSGIEHLGNRRLETECPREHDDNISVMSEVIDVPPEGDQGGEGDEPGGRRFKRSRQHQFRIGRRFSSQKMVRKMKKAVHFGKKSTNSEIDIEVHHTKIQLPQQESFGKRSGGGGRRANECLILEPSEMIVIDYPDVQLMRPGQRVSCNTMNLEKLMALEQDEITIRPGGRGAPPPPPGHHHHQYEADHHHHHHHLPHHHHSHHDTYLPDLVGSAILRGARSRGSVGSSVRDGSDTSSAYSGSDTMCHSLQSSLEPDDVDLSGLTESAVDSDEEDLAESIESLAVRDAVRECLEKDPSERTEDDIKVLLEFTQRLRAFSNMTLAVRKAMCQAMVFAVVEEAGTILMNHGEELDSWSVIINGHVEVTQPDGSVHELHLGDSSFLSPSFGITPTMEKLYHQGTMRSKVDDCQFVCIRQTDYYRILHQSEENIRRHEENGVLVLVTEQRPIDAGNRKGNIVIKGTAERLMHQLVEVENNVDPTYVEDFLLTHRTFIESPLVVANKLLQWFEDPSLRDRVTRVVLLWVNNHFTDFEMDPVMMNFLEQFEEGLEREKMAGQLRLLDFACATKARARTVTLTRPSRDEILHFSILGGYERGYGIFISKVEKGSKAEDVGLKRGDQILEVNGQSFDHMNHAKALEILRQTCHLSITVKSNLLAFKEMLTTPENSPRPRSRKSSDVRGIADINSHLAHNSAFTSAMNIPIDHIQQSPRDKGKVGNNKGSFMTTKANKLKKKVIESLMPKNNAFDQDSQANSDDSVSSHSSVGGGLYHSQSNPDLSTTGTYDDVRTEFPEHVLKVYRATDQQARFLPVHKETTAREVVMLALQIFNINDPTGSSNYALYEVTVTEEGITKQKRLPDSLQNLAERIGLSSRYYLKNITVSQTLFPDDIVSELIRESTVYFLQLNSVELAIQLTLEDYTVFRQIEPTEYIDYLFNLKSNYGTPALSLFAELVNREMFWVVSEVTSEHNLVKRSKTVKQFIKVARQCKECKNFNSMFAILSGLGHGSVSRLKQTWERLPSKYQRMYHEMQELMDPSRNMSKYRNLVQNENIQSPIIPFYPVVARDLTFTHEGNDDKVEGLINFEKLRMISRYIRDLQNMCSAPYDLFNIQDAGGQPPSSALISLNQMAAGGHQIATVKRRKKSTAAPDKKKMYEEAQMVRRVKAYLSRMSIITDEEQLRNMSYECEGGSEGHKTAGGSVSHNSNSSSGSNSAPPTNPPPRKRPNSPTPSTTSSTSSTSQTSDGKKQTAKFGATSPQSISKMKALAEPKTKPHHGPRSTTTHHSLSPTPSPGPPRRGAMTNNNSRSTHERSHSDTHAVPVDLSAESSSVTSLSKLHKSHTSGSMTSTECHVGLGESDSGISTHFDGHSSSSLEVGGVLGYDCLYHSSPPAHHRRYSHQPESRSRPPFPHAVAVLPPVPAAGMGGMGSARIRRGAPGVPPDYIATQLRMKQMGRALSHDGVQYYPQTHHDGT